MPIYLSEFLPPQYHFAAYTILLTVDSAIGFLPVSLSEFFLQGHELSILLVLVVLTLINIVFVHACVPESPALLLDKGNKKEFVEVMTRIANDNGV